MKTALINILLLGSGTMAYFSCQPTGEHSRAPSEYPIRYSVGEIDPGFGLERERFITLAREAERTWEKPLGLELFEYDPTSEFAVNLIFDERQQHTLEAKQAKAELDAREGSIRTLMREYNTASEKQNRLKSLHESEVASFDRRLERYNETVAEWNRKGGAPSNVFAELRDEQKRIEETRRTIDESASGLNEAAAMLNSLAERVNAMAAEFNMDVNLFNGRFVESREFEQGQYDGKGIAIYQFTEESDLRVALMHEFGHALGFGHVDTPESVMYRRLEKQNMETPELTPDDLELLQQKFRNQR